ncbi:hypothetical protein E0Z06_04565 [Rheinheimera sp. D18]|uniref:tyrosine-type recombinase/integrase n=1 Tax=Rheinheimera sp. D18 TaxID=2545632 RepID=UPI001045015B|nr:tyrosine-type recombinase/integrase [Rheinheimera sp. D18]QBL08832.1 hypothetical protein E0Z06_04565 [Rheinheimera sp. D18]
MILTKGSEPVNFNSLLGKKRLSEPDKVFRAKVSHFLSCSLEKTIELAKRAMLNGEFNHELLEAFRHVPSGIWKKHYNAGETSEQHLSINQHTIVRFAAEAVSQNFESSPWLDDALMQQALIAELQKLGREFREFRCAKWHSNSPLTTDEQQELFNALKTLKQFLNQTRRIEREQYRAENEHLHLQQCIDEFLLLHKLGKGRAQYILAFKFLVEKFGAKFIVSDFNAECANEIIRFLRSTRKGRKRYVSDSSGESVTFELKAKTLNKYISNYNCFFDWLINRSRYLSPNPFSKAAIPKADKDSLTRRSFAIDEIQLILNYRPGRPNEARSFRQAVKWIPKICLYTGMRPIEVVSLRVNQIKECNGIVYISLSEQRGKTPSSRRIIPIHSMLIKRGFLEYIELMRMRKQVVLFPELYPNKAYRLNSRAVGKVSKWFNQTAMTKMGMSKENELKMSTLLDLYCCRHTVASLFKTKGANGYVVKTLLGHFPEDEITFGVYAGRAQIPLEVLKETIELLDYELRT